MGGHGSGRRDRTTELIKSMKGQSFEPKTPIATEMYLPNDSQLKGGAFQGKFRSIAIGEGANFDHELDVHGVVEIEHTAANADDHAIEIDVDAAGFGDVKGIDIAYITGAIATGKDEEIILINIDQTLATGGDIAGVEVLSTEGSATVHGLEVGALVAPIEQISGVFVDMDRFLVKTSNETNNVKDGGAGNVSFHVADDDTITIGDTAVYQEIEFILDTEASGGGVMPTFEFSTGVDAWTTFSPTDGTNGFRNTGIVFFIASDVPTWAVGANSEFLIRITRTRNNLTTTPIVDKVQIVKGTEFSWDKDGDVFLNNGVFSETLTVNQSSANSGGNAKLWITGGNLAIDNTFGVAVKDSAGTYRSLMVYTSSNNMQYANTASTGDIQFNEKNNAGRTNISSV